MKYLRNHAVIVAAGALLLGLAACNESTNPVVPETVGADQTLAAKPHCPDDPTHPSCKGDDDAAPGGAHFVPVSFPDALLNPPGGENAMIDPGGQTIKHQDGSVDLNGFNPNYEVRLNFTATKALAVSEVGAGFSQCVTEAKKSAFTSVDQLNLLEMMTDDTQLRYTIVRIKADGLGAEDPEHELFTQSDDEALGGVSLTIEDSPKVERLTSTGAQSGTYRFSGGTLRLYRGLGKGGFEKIVCPNLDLVDVVWDLGD